MKTDTKFTILSTRAPLVEVDGDGPYYLTPGGVSVPDAARTTARLDLKRAPVRCFRVEAPETMRTAVIVTDSPHGAFAHVRRCIQPAEPARWWHAIAADRWPRVGALLRRRAPSALALWHLLTDDLQPCGWSDIGNTWTDHVMARGGDVVVVSFVTAEGDHA